MRKSAFLALTLCASLLAGCSDWERTSFNTLSASKAVLDQAQADYEARKIPRTQCAHDVITEAKRVDGLGVNALMAYEVAKNNHADTTSAMSTVNGEIAELAPLMLQVKSLSTSAPYCK